MNVKKECEVKIKDLSRKNRTQEKYTNQLLPCNGKYIAIFSNKITNLTFQVPSKMS